jgi:hypothetical protein
LGRCGPTSKTVNVQFEIRSERFKLQTRKNVDHDAKIRGVAEGRWMITTTSLLTLLLHTDTIDTEQDEETVIFYLYSLGLVAVET